MFIEKEELIIKKYYREIYHTKVRVLERLPKLTHEEIINLEYRSEPRNKAEYEIKENFMGFIGQRILEKYPRKDALEMAKICINEAINQVKQEYLKKCKKK